MKSQREFDWTDTVLFRLNEINCIVVQQLEKEKTQFYGRKTISKELIFFP